MRILFLALCLVAACVDAFHLSFQSHPQPLGQRQQAPSWTVRKVVELNASSLFVQVDDFWQPFPYMAAAIVCGIKRLLLPTFCGSVIRIVIIDRGTKGTT
jgi:hypothetical protein